MKYTMHYIFNGSEHHIDTPKSEIIPKYTKLLLDNGVKELQIDGFDSNSTKQHIMHEIMNYYSSDTMHESIGAFSKEKSLISYYYMPSRIRSTVEIIEEEASIKLNRVTVNYAVNVLNSNSIQVSGELARLVKV